MPELPDVEGFRRLLQDHVVGERIADVCVRDPGVIRGLSSVDFVRLLDGRMFTQPMRLGKWLLAHTDGPTLLFHFGMTGSVVWASPEAPGPQFDRVEIRVGNGKLIYCDQRKLRGLWLADGDRNIAEVIGEQGPDALGLTGSALAARLDGRRGRLKSVLMDQRVLAGLGNMLSDEVLWQAGIQPMRHLGELQRHERRELDRTLQRVLRASVKVGHIPRGATWLSSQRSESNPRCPRCREPLQVERIGGRTSYWCPVCQPLSD